MVSAALLIIGSEMVDPLRGDANGPVARLALAELGIGVSLLVRVEDRVEAIAAAMETALAICDVVIASGGLGPTGDDVTREAAAALLGVGIGEDAGWLEVLEGRFKLRGLIMDALDRRQGLVVEGGEAIPNPAGLACGCWLKPGGKNLVLLPGVPREFKKMLADTVIPRLGAAYPERPGVCVVKAVAAGLSEVKAEATLAQWYGREGVAVSILPSAGIQRITFTITSPPAAEPAALEFEVKEALIKGLGDHLVSLDGAEPAEKLGDALCARGWTVACAESCTGGLLSHTMVSVPGASRYFMGGIIAYHNEAKQRLLGVPTKVLESEGAVSEATARAMVRGARAGFGTACGVATTGIAGPTGGSPEKPEGTLWVAVATPEGEWARKFFFPVGRGLFTELAANTALYLLWRRLGVGGVRGAG